MLEKITPVILTFNEAPNIGRTLEKLAWARDIVIVDSGSTDATLAIAREYPQVRVFQRSFDTHAAQWTYAIAETAIDTEWVLALDADYVLSDACVEEMSRLTPPTDVTGIEARFVYCTAGKPLRGALYPPVTVLFRPRNASFVQDGHTHRVRVAGRIARLEAPIFHDDRKPLKHWLAAQRRYMKLEAEMLAPAAWRSLNWPDRVRALRVVAPPVVALYCLFGKGLILDGAPGIFYSLQRGYAEALLSYYLLRQDLRMSGRTARGAR